MITEIKLKNWRSHLDSSFSFESGTNALIGIMGSGKTSLMEAICFGLFGTTPVLQSKKIKIDDMIMKKPVEKNSAEINLSLKLDGSDYFVKRIIEKGKGTTYSEIRENGRLLEAPSTSRVTEIIQNILKVNFELFSKAIYSEQNSLDYFLTIPRGQRMKKIDELLMIDKFEKARSAAITLTNKLEERRLARQSVVENADVESLKKNISDIDESMKLLANEIENLKSELSKNKIAREKTEQEYNEISIFVKNVEQLNLQIEKKLSTLNEIEKSVSNLKNEIATNSRASVEKQVTYLKDKIIRNESELSNLEERYDNLSKEVSELKSAASYLKKEIEILEKEFYEQSELKKEFEHLRDTMGENIGQQIEEAKKNLQTTTEAAARVMTRISDNEQFIVHLSTPDNKCPICESILTNERKKLLIIQKEGEIKKLYDEFDFTEKNKMKIQDKIKELEDASVKITLISQKIKNLDSINKDLEKSKRNFAEQNNKLVYAQNTLTDIRRNLEKIQDEIASDKLAEQKLQTLLERITDFEKQNSRMKEIEMEISELKQKLSLIKERVEGKNLEEFEKELRNLISREKGTEAEINGVERVSKEKLLRLNELENKLTEIRIYQKEIEKIQKLIKNMKIFEKSLEQTQIELRKEFVQAVNYTMTNLWETLYPYQDFVGIRLNVEEGDYILQLMERTGKWINVEGIVSGGERSIASLALRIAFSLVLAPQLRWLILDEPTHNLDQNAVEDLAETLRERIGEFVDQVFLITHDEKLENAVTGSLYRLEREKEKDGVTKVILIS